MNRILKISEIFILITFFSLSIFAKRMIPVSTNPSTIPTQYHDFVKAIGKSSNGCTLTHVGKGIVVTAGHCFKAKTFKQFDKSCAWISSTWGYYAGSENNFSSRCNKILVMQKNENVDYAILQFDKFPIASVNVNVNYSTPIDSEISIFGHPWGKYLHWSSDCTVQSYLKSRYAGVDQFSHACDSEPGFSGAPIIDVNSSKMIGIHSGGNAKWFFGTFLSNVPLSKYL
jgi:V8-like Glu-specific endopeptidase